MSASYIVRKLSDNNLNEITIPEDYEVVAQSNSRTLSLDGFQFIALGDEDLIYPIVSISELGDPPYKNIYIVENLPKIDLYNALILEQSNLRAEIKSVNFLSGTLLQLLLNLRKIARFQQIKIKLEENDF